MKLFAAMKRAVMLNEVLLSHYRTTKHSEMLPAVSMTVRDRDFHCGTIVTRHPSLPHSATLSLRSILSHNHHNIRARRHTLGRALA